MLLVGSPVVADGARFKEITLPSLERVLDRGDVILSSTGDIRGIAAVYNDFVREARTRSDCEALVLLHDDVEIVDPNFRAKILAAVREERVGVVGTVGAADLHSAGWWAGRYTAGRVFESRGSMQPGPPRADVDVVDGLLMAISPRAFHIMFDEQMCPRFHGYDVDYCLQVRAAGLRVTVRPIEVLHRTKGGFGDWDTYSDAARAIAAKWPKYIRPPTTLERARWWRTKILKSIIKTDSPRDAGSVEAEASRQRGSKGRKRVEWMALYLSDGCLLEIGCGTGEFLKAAEDEGYDVFGVEPNEWAAQQARGLGLPVETGSLSDWVALYRGLRPDAVCLWHAFRDVSAPLELLQEVIATLAPGGYVFLEVPSAQYTPDGLARLLDRAGFEQVQLLPTTRRIYESALSWRRARNAALVERHDWPPLDLLRGVARSPI